MISLKIKLYGDIEAVDSNDNFYFSVKIKFKINGETILNFYIENHLILKTI